jgi:serine/threonine-protein phosphatase 6 regulatory ankyrin repeat subunit A
VKALLDAKASVNMVNCMGLTPIMHSHDLKITKALVQAGADVITPTEYRTVLNMACKTRKLDIIQYLVSQGADVNLSDRYGRTPLMSVFEINKDAPVTKHSWSAHPRRKYSNEKPVTKDAELPAIVDFLLSAGARVDAVDQYGDSALMGAARYKGDDRDAHLVAVKKLVDAGGASLVNMQNNAKDTALCTVQSVAVAEVLVAAGADVNLCLRGDRSPLSLACLSNNAELVGFLIQSGANIKDLNQLDEIRQDVVFRVVKSRHFRVLLKLIDGKADVNVFSEPPNSYPLTPLMHAVVNNLPAEAALLINGGANVRLYLERSSTLMLACSQRSDANPEIVKMLLDAGAVEDIDGMQGKTGETAYNIAVNGGAPQSVIDVLVAAGCNTADREYCRYY